MSTAPFTAQTVVEDAEAAILATGLTKNFGETCAVAGVDLTVERGTVTALLGPNGAGKTTTVRILTTLLKPDGGSATVAGHDIARSPGAVRARIGLTGQFTAIDELLTGRENLIMIGRLARMQKAAAADRAVELLARFELADDADRRAGTYSGGMRRRLDLAASLIANPEVLFLDEPTTGLDPRSRLGMWELIEELVAQGTTVLLTTQYLDEADALADEIIVIDHGRVIARGTSDTLKDEIGGERLELRLVDPARTAHASARLTAAGVEVAGAGEAEGTISVALTRGPVEIAELIQTLDRDGFTLDEVTVHRPTLDDVFLTLTGQHAEDAGDALREGRE
ncbi:MAG: ATP-binding cassette domain-containing protein [Actinobacteria bacterium]|nr:ATP-binding cassette domain-containing protein [Actinomycetota bacterium]